MENVPEFGNEWTLKLPQNLAYGFVPLGRTRISCQRVAAVCFYLYSKFYPNSDSLTSTCRAWPAPWPNNPHHVAPLSSQLHSPPFYFILIINAYNHRRSQQR